jgi:hypothetical protein
MMTGVPSAIPEIPFAKKTQQKGIVKLAAFAFNQQTGQAIWQSGTYPITADARDTWFLGTGPFQRGSIYPGTNFAGQRVGWFGRRRSGNIEPRPLAPGLSVTAAATFSEDLDLAAEKAEKSGSDVAPASGSERKSDQSKPPSFKPGIPPSQPQLGRVPTPDVLPASAPASPSSGYTSSTYSSSSSHDAKASSGGSAAAAGLMILQKQAKDPAR